MSTILIVDDEEEILQALQFAWELEGHRVHTASSLSQALETLTGHEIDALITDLRMPEGSGLELLKKAAELHPQAIMILMTGVDAHTLSSSDRKLCHFVFQKPFDMDHLLSVIS